MMKLRNETSRSDWLDRHSCHYHEGNVSYTPDTTKPRLESRLCHLNMVPVGDFTGLASKPTRWVRNSQTLKTTKGRYKSDLLCLVPVGGLEPPRPKATDFESVVYTNFTIPALSWGIALSMSGIIRMRTDVASIKTWIHVCLPIISPLSHKLCVMSLFTPSLRLYSDA